MGLKQRHRRLLVGLLVLGCVGLARATAIEAAQWHGEGTIETEENYDKSFPGITVWRTTTSGSFTITFEVGEHFITGKGIATVTATLEYVQPDPNHRLAAMQCTGRWKTTVPLIVSGVKVDSRLRLSVNIKFAVAGAKLEYTTLSSSCAEPYAELAASSSLMRPRFVVDMTKDMWLDVVAEDGAKGYLDKHVSSTLPEMKGRQTWSVQINTAPPPASEPELVNCPADFKIEHFAGLVIVPWDESLAQLWIWPDGTTDLIYPDGTGSRLVGPENVIRIDHNYTAELEYRKREAYTAALLGFAEGISKAGIFVTGAAMLVVLPETVALNLAKAAPLVETGVDVGNVAVAIVDAISNPNLQSLAGLGVAAGDLLSGPLPFGDINTARYLSVPLPHPGEKPLQYGQRVHQEHPRLVKEAYPQAKGKFNVLPGQTGPDFVPESGINATFVEMKSLWDRASRVLKQARDWQCRYGYEPQTGRYFFYDRNTGRVFEGIYQD